MTQRAPLMAAILVLASTTATTVFAQTPTPPGEPDPFTHIFHNLFLDAKRLPSIDTAITLGIGGGLALAVHPFDDEVTEHATAGGPKTFFEVGSTIGDGWAQVGFAVGTYATGLIAHKTSATHLGSDLIRAQVINAVVTQGVKFAVRRERPGDPAGTSYAFPSGHTSSAFATATVVWRHFGWKAGLPASAVGAWVGAGRVQLGKHFLSDVVFGAAVGTMSGRTVTIGHGRTKVAVSPAAVPGGAAIAFTLIAR
jgi:membrane-associated phospholipid phosphatase